MDRKQMLNAIMAYDFALDDLNLFLDTHPFNNKAISDYNVCLEKSKQLREQYQKKYGPLTTRYSKNDDFWEWIEDPWPWDTQMEGE